MLCLKERRLFDGDDGGGAGGGADEGFGVSDFGGFESSGQAQAAEAADAAGPAAAAGTGISMDFAAPAAPGGVAGISAPTAAQDVGFGSTSPGTGDFGVSISPEFAAPAAPGTPGISAPTAGQDVGFGSLSPGTLSPAISPEFAAPNDPVTPGISAPTQAQDIALESAAPAPGTTAFAPEEQSLFDRELFDVPKLLNQPIVPNTPGRLAMTALGLVNPAFTAFGLLGRGLTALGATPGTDIDAYGAAIGDVGTTDEGGGSQGSGGQANDALAGIDPLGGPLAPPGAPGAPGGLPATPPPGSQRPTRLNIPPELLPYLNPGMTDLQLRAAISTGALYNANPVYRSQNVKDFYNNLVARSLIDESGNFNDLSDILPVEQQYALQSRGVESYAPTSEAFLQALQAA